MPRSDPTKHTCTHTHTHTHITLHTPVVVLMLAFTGASAELLDAVPFDGVLVEDKTGTAVVSYLARESSKPGRGGESLSTWVAHATPAFATAVLGFAARGPPASDPTAADALVKAEEAMTASVHEIFSQWLPAGEKPVPAHAKCHRWGAAFPSKPKGDGLAIVECEGRVVCVGDYLGDRFARVEGAVASANAGAEAILAACATEE